MSIKISEDNRPTIAQLEREIERVTSKHGARKAIRIIVYVSLMSIAVLMIAVSFLMPVLKVYGDSMQPNVSDGDIVICIKQSTFEQGDVIAFNHDGKVLIRRVIGIGGDKINIDDSGNVYVNDIILDEPYIDTKSHDICDIDLPYTVPDGSYFVMGDNRQTAVDSRCKEIGTVKPDAVIGKLLVCIWPIQSVHVNLGF